MLSSAEILESFVTHRRGDAIGLREGMIDLHGRSVEDAQALVKQHLSKVEPGSTWRFVTGRGNHKNKKGERGTLYKKFPEFLQDASFKNRILSVTPYDGYYEVTIKEDVKKRIPLEDLFKPFFEEDLKASFELLLKSVKTRDAKSQVTLGYCYYNGIGIEANLKQAIHWYQKAVAQGDSGAKFLLGVCYWVGKGVQRNDNEALRLLKEAADEGCIMAQIQLGEIYLNGISVKYDLPLAIDYYSKAAAQDNPLAMRKLAQFYLLGCSVQKDIPKAFELYRKAAERGDAYAQYNLAALYLNGTEGVRPDPQKSADYMRQAAQNGDLDAQREHGFYLLNVKETADEVNGLKWLMNAAEHGDGKANFILSQFYKHKGDEEKANCFLQKASEANYIMADFLVAMSSFEESKLNKLLAHYEHEILGLDVHFKYFVIDLLASADATRKEKEKCLRLLHHLAKSNCKHAYARLGELHYAGKIVQQNVKKALSYWNQGANQDHVGCLITLAGLSMSGMHVEKNLQAAINYLEKTRDKNDFFASYQLGRCYVSRNKKDDVYLARDCFERAYNLENQIAEDLRIGCVFSGRIKSTIRPEIAYSLAYLYYTHGDKFENGDNQAIAWCKRANALGNKQAFGLLVEIYNRSAKVEELYHEVILWAEQGNTEAKLFLERFRASAHYEQGITKRQTAATKQPSRNEKLDPKLHPQVSSPSQPASSSARILNSFNNTPENSANQQAEKTTTMIHSTQVESFPHPTSRRDVSTPFWHNSTNTPENTPKSEENSGINTTILVAGIAIASVAICRMM